MDIEAISVCVNYSDLLAQTAIFNRPLLKKWLAVTTTADADTRSLCRKLSIDCVTTDEHTRDGPFSKGRMIDRGVAHLNGSGWNLFLDVDIALPGDLHQVLEEAHLDETCIYGCDRFNVTGWDAWQRVKANGLWCRNNPWMVGMDRPDCKVGARVANTGHGFTPLGFTQLIHGDAMNWRSFPAKRYANSHGNAARTDIQMSLHFDRRKRVLIPELMVWHLESEPAKMGANWSGRTTKRFGPPDESASKVGVDGSYCGRSPPPA